MALRTWLSERFGLTVPVVGAPMAGIGSGRLAHAVSAAGALGMVGVGPNTEASWITEQVQVAAPGGPYGVGLMAWVLGHHGAQLDAVLEARPDLVSVSFGPYAAAAAPLRDAGCVVVTQVGSGDDARAAEQAGVDAVVARGGEGGGHGRNVVATLPLLETVLGAVDVPVLAAGGISGGRTLAAVLAAGAAGAWVGTAFMACAEADTTEAARRMLFAAAETDTAYGRVFDIANKLDWPPEFGGRALRNAFFDRWVGREDELAADPNAFEELAQAGERQDYATTNIYAGQGVGLLTRSRPAAEVVAEFATAESFLSRAASG
jgi:nitronate monooxygenase